MKKFWSKHSVAMRVTLTVLFSVLGIAVLFWAATIILSQTTLTYDLGDYQEEKEYRDVILTSYEEYEALMEEYELTPELKYSDFNDSYFIASFQDFDRCAERLRKSVDEIKIGNSIDITFTIHNKCGWCEAKPVLYLIRIDQIAKTDIPINYKYVYERSLECGDV